MTASPMLIGSYFLIAFALSLAIVPACRAAALRLGYVAAPKADRWHTRQTALLGGVAIGVVTLGGGITLRPFSQISLFVVAGLAVLAVGLVDDIVSLKPATKLVAQICLASVFVFYGYRLQWVESMTLDAMLTLAWLVGVTNAFNLLDNMDGLCAGIALIVATTLLTGFIQGGDLGSHARYLALFVGAVAGFLVYNFNPASIFMGDSGSLFIGLTLAAMALEPVHGSSSGSNLLAVIGAPLLVLLLPIFDTTLVTVSRLMSGRSPAHGGRDHSSHRLVAIGLSERRAVAVLWVLAALGALIGLGVRLLAADIAAPLALSFVLAMVVFAVYLGRVRVYADADESLLRTGRVTPFVANWMHKRRAAEVVLDLCLVSLCYYGAYRLRFEGVEFGLFFPKFIASLPLVIGLQIATLFAVGGYRGVWRHFGLMDAVVFAKGVVLGTTASVVAIVYLYRFQHYSRSVFVIYAALLMIALSGSRASFRLISEFAHRRRTGRRLVIYGAGDAGTMIAREVMHDGAEHYTMLGFIDDDAQTAKTRLQGYPVLGGFDTLLVLIAADAIDVVILSAKTLEGERVKALERLCAEHGVALSRVQLTIEQLVAS